VQIVYLSAHPGQIAETLQHVAHYAPFVSRALVLTPKRLLDEMQRALEPASIPVDFVTDEDVTGLSTAAIQALNHAERNYRLRVAAASHDALDEVFIMSDGDSRPLAPVDQGTFIDASGRHRRRFFYALARWRNDATDYDRSLFYSWVILRQRGFSDALCYASHMPQIIDKAIYREVAEMIAVEAAAYPPDEWSPYFTIGPALHPDRFADPEPFLTLGWPRHPGEWPHEVVPPISLFENFHPELYDENGLYGGLATGCDPETIDATNLEKVVRWYQLERDVRRLDFPDDIDQPWTNSLPRKVAFTGLRAARSAFRYMSIDERTRLGELEAEVQRLRRENPS